MAYSVSDESLESLEEDWLRLLPEAAVDVIFSLPIWKKVWWRAFGGGREALLLAMRDQGRLVGIAPLVRADKSAQVRFIGDTRVSDYSDFVVARGHEEGFYGSLLDALEARGITSLYLESVPASSPTLDHLPRLARLRGYSVHLDVEDVCPRVELPATWEDYLNLLPGKGRHELRRKLRRLLDRRQVSWYCLECSQLTPQDLEDFFRLFRLSRDEKARFLSPDMEAFFQDMSQALSQAGYLRLFFLEVGGVRIAATLCFDYRDELLLYNSGYDPAYGWLSVGLLLKALCLQTAIQAGRKRFDFLRGAEEYKYDLGARDLPIYRCLIERG